MSLDYIVPDTVQGPLEYQNISSSEVRNKQSRNGRRCYVKRLTTVVGTQVRTDPTEKSQTHFGNAPRPGRVPEGVLLR